MRILAVRRAEEVLIVPWRRSSEEDGCRCVGRRCTTSPGRAGVSVATVSRVVNNERYISAQTRRPSSRPSRASGSGATSPARTLRSGQNTDTVALVIEDVANRSGPPSPRAPRTWPAATSTCSSSVAPARASTPSASCCATWSCAAGSTACWWCRRRTRSGPCTTSRPPSP
ncbi:LacI family DNA-binding transcriptional regulator [Dactylosporangium darangshiense]|uniref:LacI family DNA-binding transcriptional regulator n=1 Tax=Dactylosporangium darangshiense TaxID=579108 RepID=UPI00363D2389